MYLAEVMEKMGLTKNDLGLRIGAFGAEPWSEDMRHAIEYKLGIKAGDRMTLLLYEEESGRTRPVLLTIAGIFPSVYPQLDSNLLYIPLETSGYDPDGYEVLFPPGSDTEGTERKLGASGCSFSFIKPTIITCPALSSGDMAATMRAARSSTVSLPDTFAIVSGAG